VEDPAESGGREGTKTGGLSPCLLLRCVFLGGLILFFNRPGLRVLAWIVSQRRVTDARPGSARADRGNAVPLCGAKGEKQGGSSGFCFECLRSGLEFPSTCSGSARDEPARTK
jgi:hypothetical protein